MTGGARKEGGSELSVEEQKILHEELGISFVDFSNGGRDSSDSGGGNAASRASATTAAKVVGGIALLANVAVLCSLPPVLRGKGAPYLPTFRKQMDEMFTKLRHDPDFASLLSRRRRRRLHIHQQQEENNTAAIRTRRTTIRFVDLGSGDGRMVFRAARERDMFDEAVGYEINPFLHAFAQTRKFVLQPNWYLFNTTFRCANLWNVDLSRSGSSDNADVTTVVAVYGLGPIMKDLGIKLRKELRPGSFVLSNVFPFPSWKPAAVRLASKQQQQGNTYLYKIPECWEKSKGRKCY